MAVPKSSMVVERGMAIRQTPRAIQADQTLVAFFEQMVTTYSSQPALLYKPNLKTEVWTYRDLGETAHRVAHWLQMHQIGKGDRVVIWAPNSPWWVACFFGILCNGSIVVPLDVRSSAEFVERVISQSEPRLVIASADRAKDPIHGTAVFAVEDLDRLLPEYGPSTLPEIGPDDLAEIVFTSGTTGVPKGVMLTHCNIRSNLEALYQLVPSDPQFRALSILPLSHLLEQVCGLLLPLRGGAAIAYATTLLPTALQRDMAEYRVTTMVFVPRILSTFMEAIESRVRREGKEKSWRLAHRIAEHVPMRARRILFRSVIRSFGGHLQFLVSAGAPLDPGLEHKWELLGIAILQGYGSTETSPIITGTSVSDRRPRSVGKALPGTEMRLTSDGEILVKGPNVMRGYWKNPEATAAALEDGWYHTGDLGELDAEGRLYLKGRKKDLIVLANGMKVYPEDVEDALRRVAGVVDSVVLAVPSAYGPQIHAVLLCEADRPDPAVIIRMANEHLAPHQRIRSYDVWSGPDFPRTHTIKVRRAEVAKVVMAAQQGEKVSAPAPTLQSSSKPTLVQILAGVVSKPAEELKAEARLRDIGLDAARRIQLGRAVENRLGKFMDESRIGADSTVADLESLLAAENPAGGQPHPYRPLSRQARFVRALLRMPLLAAQRAIVRQRTLGLEHLAGLELPAIFVLEHGSLLDAPCVLASMPRRIRQRVSISTPGEAEHRNQWIDAASALFLNSFRYPRSGSQQAALVHAAELLDHGRPILYLLRGDPEQPGHAGGIIASINLLATEFGVPIIPLHVARLNGGSALRYIPRRGTATVRLGQPIVCRPGISYGDVETAVKAGFRALRAET